MRMTITEFHRRKLAGRLTSKSVQGAFMVLVRGISRNEAGHRTGVDPSCVSRMSKQISEMKVCKHCGQVKIV